MTQETMFVDQCGVLVPKYPNFPGFRGKRGGITNTNQ
jgi:hypothetical protein